MAEGDGAAAAGLRVRESVVRQGWLVATVRAEPGLALAMQGRLVLTVNHEVLAEAEPPLPGQEVILRAPLPPPAVTFDEVGVSLMAEGVRTALEGDAAHHLPRLAVRTVDEFIDSVQRKGFRIADDETLVEAARRCMLRFVGEIATVAVAACVIGYRYVDHPDWADTAALDLLAAQADAVRAAIDETIFEEARWAPTIDVMLYQVFAVHGHHQRAVRYLCRLYADRPLIHIEPMCAYNLSLGVLTLGYLYFLQGRMREAVSVWAAYEEIFVTAAVKQPKRLGTIREFGFIHKNSVLAVAGMVQAKSRNPAQRSGMITEERMAKQAVRSTAPEAERRIRRFFDAARSGEVALPPAKTLVSSRPDQWY